jgi:hypothetical protein
MSATFCVASSFTCKLWRMDIYGMHCYNTQMCAETRNTIYRMAQKSLDTKGNKLSIEYEVIFVPLCILNIFYDCIINSNINENPYLYYFLNYIEDGICHWRVKDTYFKTHFEL